MAAAVNHFQGIFRVLVDVGMEPTPAATCALNFIADRLTAPELARKSLSAGKALSLGFLRELLPNHSTSPKHFDLISAIVLEIFSSEKLLSKCCSMRPVKESASSETDDAIVAPVAGRRKSAGADVTLSPELMPTEAARQLPESERIRLDNPGDDPRQMLDMLFNGLSSDNFDGGLEALLRGAGHRRRRAAIALPSEPGQVVVNSDPREVNLPALSHAGCDADAAPIDVEGLVDLYRDMLGDDPIKSPFKSVLVQAVQTVTSRTPSDVTPRTPPPTRPTNTTATASAVSGSDAMQLDADTPPASATASPTGSAAKASDTSSTVNNRVTALRCWLLCPLLSEPSEAATFLVPLCNAVYLMSSIDRRQLVDSYTTSPAAEQEHVVTSCQQFITVQLYGQEGAGARETAVALNMLDICNIANERRFLTHGSRLLPTDRFINDTVNEEVEIELQYDRWVERSTEDPSRFTFCAFPFVLDASSKSAILQQDLAKQRRAAFREHAGRMQQPFLVLEVRRSDVVQDTMSRLAGVPAQALKRPMRVKFVGEEGVDEGGVRKEFFQVMLRALLDPNFGMFLQDPDSRLLWFNPHTMEANIEFELVGMLLGLALYNAVLLDVHFPLALYYKLLHLRPSLALLRLSDPEVAKGLDQLLEYEGDDLEDVFCLSFETTEMVWGAPQVVPLVEGGGSIPVTQTNKHDYVSAFVQYKLETSIEAQYNAFHKGFHRVVDDAILQLLRPEELELLICGKKELDFDDLRAGAHYTDGYDEHSRIVGWFWEVVSEFDETEKKKFLAFATGSDRSPVSGLSSLELVISRASPDSEHLPTAHTCFNHLLIPDYPTKDKLRDKLRTAINQSEGFGLL